MARPMIGCPVNTKKNPAAKMIDPRNFELWENTENRRERREGTGDRDRHRHGRGRRGGGEQGGERSMIHCCCSALF